MADASVVIPLTSDAGLVAQQRHVRAAPSGGPTVGAPARATALPLTQQPIMEAETSPARMPALGTVEETMEHRSWATRGAERCAVGRAGGIAGSIGRQAFDSALSRRSRKRASAHPLGGVGIMCWQRANWESYPPDGGFRHIAARSANNGFRYDGLVCIARSPSAPQRGTRVLGEAHVFDLLGKSWRMRPIEPRSHGCMCFPACHAPIIIVFRRNLLRLHTLV